MCDSLVGGVQQARWAVRWLILGVQDLRCISRLLSSGMWSHLVWYNCCWMVTLPGNILSHCRGLSTLQRTSYFICYCSIKRAIFFRPKSIENDEFCRDCVRCGRTLVNAGEHVWRWTGFNMGLDLIWSCSTRTLRVKRNHRTEHEVMLSLQSRRHIMCR